MTAQEIKNIIESNEYEWYGLRYDNQNYEIGDICERSHNWWQDDPNGDLDEDDPWYTPYNDKMGLWDGGELEGTSSVEVNRDNVDKALKRLENYIVCGSRAYLIAGNYAQGGNDTGEIVIADAVVIAEL